MKNKKNLIIYLALLAIFSTNIATSAKPPKKTPKWDLSTPEKKKTKRFGILKKKPQEKEIKKGKETETVILQQTQDEQTDPKPLQLPFNKWVEFLENNWSTESNHTKKDLQVSVLEKSTKLLEIINEFISTNMKILEKKSMWDKDEIPEEINELKELETKIKKDPVNINVINGKYFKEKNNKFISPILPIAQKLIIPKNDHAFVFGDFHGNFDALKKLIQNLIDKEKLDNNLKLKPNNYLVFLGDYVDRGQQGIEILLTLFRLKIQNTKQVILLRGNHEDFQQNFVDGFILKQDEYERIENGELPKKLYHLEDENFDDYLQIINKILFSYELMPTTLFLGYKDKSKPIKFIELSHAAIDHRYNPKEFLDVQLPEDKSTQFSIIKFENFMNLKKIIIKYYNLIEGKYKKDNLENIIKDFTKNPKNKTLSFTWSDIDHNATKEKAKIDVSKRGVGFVYNPQFLKKYFDKVSSDDNKVVMLIRGHEHGIPVEKRNDDIYNMRDKIGAINIDDIVITLMSGIYNSPKLEFDWGFDGYHPTFLDLSPPVFAPAHPTDKWKIQIKYIENGKEHVEGEKKEAIEAEEKEVQKLMPLKKSESVK